LGIALGTVERIAVGFGAATRAPRRTKIRQEVVIGEIEVARH